MAIDVYLQKNNSAPKSNENHILAFEDEGCYWFLYEYFKVLARETGQMIDFYDDAFFSGENLDLLNKAVRKAKESISKKPDVWEEYTGTTFHKGDETKAEKQFSIVRKKELEAFLAKLEEAVVKAKEKNIGIFFVGD